MSEEQDTAALFLCQASLSELSSPEKKEGHHLRIIDAADPRRVLSTFASAVWTCHSTERLRHLSGFFLRLAGNLPVSSWPAADQALRATIRQPKPTIGPLNPSRVQSLLDCLHTKKRIPDPGHILIALCHHNGWTRQAAMKLTEHLPAPLAACLLLLRANDWIPSIRAAATARIPQVFSKLDPREKLRLLPLVAHLRDCGRLEQRSLPGTWTRLLSQTLDEEAWLDAWKAAPAGQQRLYLSLLDPEHQMPGPRLRQALLRSKSRMALIFHLKHIFPRLPEEERQAAARLAAQSRVVPVRRAWLDHVMDHQPEAAPPLLIGMLVSPSRSLRDLARFHLTRLAPMDFKDHYQGQLDAGTNEEGALLGLVEVSPETAHREALKRLESPSQKIRKAAILSLSPDWVKANLSWLLSKNGWGSPAVWHATRKRLSAIPRVIGDFVLRDRDAADFPLAISLFVMSQALHFKKWDGLEYLLGMAAHPELGNDARAALHTWRRRDSASYVRLPQERKQQLFQKIEAANLPEKTGENLRFLLEKAE